MFCTHRQKGTCTQRESTLHEVFTKYLHIITLCLHNDLKSVDKGVAYMKDMKLGVFIMNTCIEMKLNYFISYMTLKI